MIRRIPGRFRSLFLAAGFLAAACCSAASAQEREDLPKTYHLDDPRFDTIIVASVGNRTITAREFLLNYDFGPAFAKRLPDSKEKYLGFMINEKLLALDGYRRGLDTMMEVRRTLADIVGDLATEELYKNDILSKVKIRASDIAAGVAGERVQLSVRWIFSPTREAIMKSAAALADGVPFDSLYAAQLHGGVTADDRSMQTSRFRLRMKNALLASIIDTLKPGTVSLPIHVPDGWYLVRIDDAWTDPIVTESAMEKMRVDVREALLQQRSDSLSDVYVSSMMTARSPVIVRKTFTILLDYLGRKVLSPAVFAEANFRERLTEPPMTDSTRSRYARRILVTMKRGAFTLGDFLDYYDTREASVNLRTSSPQEFFGSLEEWVWHMVRDRLLTERAKARGFDTRPGVQRQARWWLDKIVYNVAKGLMELSVPVSDSAIKAYYAGHTHDYRDTSGAVESFAVASSAVRHDYFTMEMTARLLRRLAVLKREYPVAVDTAALAKLPVDTEENPRAIEMYAVKKGGTFPRPAFPSIDNEWQVWE